MDTGRERLDEEVARIADELARLGASRPGAVMRILGDPRLWRYIPPTVARRALEMERVLGGATVH